MTLTTDECRALYDLLDDACGGNALAVFAWDGTDTLTDATTRAAAKVFVAAGKPIPESLGEVRS